MSRSHVRAAAAFTAALLVTTACTQNPTVVADNGQKYFGRNSHFAALKPAAGRAATPAAVQIEEPVPVIARDSAPAPVMVSDLAAPEKPAQKPVVVAAEEKPAPVQKINPWTGKPREAAAEAGGLNSARGKSVVLKTSDATSAYIWPVTGSKVISAFGPKGGGKVNDGINIAAAQGEPVWAAADGEVVYIGDELSGYGNMVLVRHGSDKTTTYAHLSRIAVDKYDRVKQGDIIGYVGQSGSAKQPQLHFAIREGKSFVDPQKYVSRSVAGL